MEQYLYIEYLDNALKRALPFWFKLGLIDNPINNPWSNLTLDTLYKQYQPLAFEIAVKAMILFKMIISFYHWILKDWKEKQLLL